MKQDLKNSSANDSIQEERNFIYNEIIIGCERFLKENAPLSNDLIFDHTDMNRISDDLRSLLSCMYHTKNANFTYFSDICKMAIHLYDSVNTNEYYMCILILNLYFWIDQATAKSFMLKNINLTLDLLSSITRHFNHQLIRNTIALIGEIFNVFTNIKSSNAAKSKGMKITIDDYYKLQDSLYEKYQFILPNLPVPFSNKSTPLIDPNNQPLLPLPQGIKQVIDLYSQYLVINDKDYCWYKEYQEIDKSSKLAAMGLGNHQSPTLLNKQDPFSLFIKSFAPKLNEFCLSLLKLLLIGAPLPSKYAQGSSPEVSPYASTEFVKDQISAIHLEMNRYRESLFYFIVKSISNLMAALKPDDIILEYFKCLLNDANIIPLLLKIIQFKDPLKFIQGIPNRQSLNILPENGEFCKTTFQGSLYALKILYKLSKHNLQRSVSLSIHKSPDIFKKWATLPNIEIQIICLKLLKLVFPFATRKFRQTNMKLASQIYCTLKFEPFEAFLKFEDLPLCQQQGELKQRQIKQIIGHKLDRLLGSGHWSFDRITAGDSEATTFLKLVTPNSGTPSLEDVSGFTEEMLLQSKEMIQLFIQKDIHYLVQNEELVAAEDASLWIQSFSDLFYIDETPDEPEPVEKRVLVVDELVETK